MYNLEKSMLILGGNEDIYLVYNMCDLIICGRVENLC